MDHNIDITRQEVEEASNIFMSYWNTGDLENACDLYAEDAEFLTAAHGRIVGRANILAYYQSHYPDRAAMGRLSLRMDSCRTVPSYPTPAAVAVFGWKLMTPGSPPPRVHTGFTLEYYEKRDGQLFLLYDASL
ncbi:MAG: hypothetical protein A2589_03500 [Candidatus Vogelbacteria bacterium RIFOXYD1_FULL_46_19]|uniref:DUF4440 domain-containing protein n=1 Tax=Candidatus Vogelbacteria bacterium RIFOXYD1_FULL_46_19 TaxID=1802439 RepID=A0A1G2QGP5_9BACT|nr:MAG: hypothetical protein A2589_03500 [Candidatus Vogelbacteria bacterium RIFOXYD1_FULL_46_19]